MVEKAVTASPAPNGKIFAANSLEMLLSGAARLRPDAVALADRTTILPFGAATAQVQALAQLFADCGLRPGEPLLLVGGAEVSIVIALLAALRGGFVPALAPIDLGAAELAAYARAIDAVALIGPTAYGELQPVQSYFAAAAVAPSIRLLATLGPDEIDGAVDLSAAAISRYAAAHPDQTVERGRPPPEPSALMTLDRSGLRPVAHKQTTLTAAALDFVARAQIGRTTPLFSCIPPTSFAGLVAGPFAAFLSGATLYLHGPFSADAFLEMRDRGGRAHLIVPAAVGSDLAAAAVLDGLASAVLVSRLADEAAFSAPAPLACSCPVTDVYAIGESAVVAEPRRGDRPVPPATEPHFIGLDEARVLAIGKAAGDELAFRGAAVTGGA